MPSPRRLLPLASLLTLLALSFSGCHRDGWISGKWNFDREYTEAHLPKLPEKPESESGMAAMKSGLVAMLIPVVINKLDGSQLEFRNGEMILTNKGGAGQVMKYTVMDRPGYDQVRLKFANGDVVTYSFTADHLVQPSTGDNPSFNAYFTRAGQ